MRVEAILAILGSLSAAASAVGDGPLSPISALGVSASMGVVGGTVSAIIKAGDASVSIRRVAVCVLTSAMVAPAASFAALHAIHDGSLHLIPVFTTSGVVGVVVWPIADKAGRAFDAVKPAAFGKWLLNALRAIIGRGP